MSSTDTRLLKILFSLGGFCLNGQNFEINKILSINYIRNIVSNEKGVYIGTSDGIFVIDKAYNLKLFKSKIKGAINAYLKPVNPSLIRYTISDNKLLQKLCQITHYKQQLNKTIIYCL